ncbi:MAG: hypothetical protein IJR90_03660 [Clostridia bacterium]|nr:hypothetical protein [Clostridia bacterium]
MPDKEKKQKRRGRRSYLNDFHLEGSEYVYRGNTYAFEGGEKERKSFLTFMTLGSLVSLLLAAGQEIFPPVEMSDSPFTTVPWLLQTIAVCTVIWGVYKLLRGGDPMREYVYEKSVKKLPVRLLIASVASFVTVASEAIYIVIKGFGRSAVNTVMRPSLALINGVLCLFLHLLAKRGRWTLINKSPAKAEVSPPQDGE